MTTPETAPHATPPVTPSTTAPLSSFPGLTRDLAIYLGVLRTPTGEVPQGEPGGRSSADVQRSAYEAGLAAIKDGTISLEAPLSADQVRDVLTARLAGHRRVARSDAEALATLEHDPDVIRYRSNPAVTAFFA